MTAVYAQYSVDCPCQGAGNACCLPPGSRLHLKVPAIEGLNCTPAQLRADGNPVPKSAANLVRALRSYRVVLVQNALELAPLYPDHQVHKWLMEQPEFRVLLAEYEVRKASGVSLG